MVFLLISTNVQWIKWRFAHHDSRKSPEDLTFLHAKSFKLSIRVRLFSACGATDFVIKWYCQKFSISAPFDSKILCFWYFYPRVGGTVVSRISDEWALNTCPRRGLTRLPRGHMPPRQISGDMIAKWTSHFICLLVSSDAAVKLSVQSFAVAVYGEPPHRKIGNIHGIYYATLLVTSWAERWHTSYSCSSERLGHFGFSVFF